MFLVFESSRATSMNGCSAACELEQYDKTKVNSKCELRLYAALHAVGFRVNPETACKMCGLTAGKVLRDSNFSSISSSSSGGGCT